MKRRHFLLVAVFALLIIVINTAIVKYIYVVNCANVPQQNLNDFRPSSCYIYLDINYDSKNFTIVYPNSVLYNQLNKYWSRTEVSYIVTLGLIMDFGMKLNVDSALFEQMKGFIIDQHTVNEYYDKDFLSDTTLIIDNYIRNDISWENTTALIYCCLRSGMNVCTECESGDLRVQKSKNNR